MDSNLRKWNWQCLVGGESHNGGIKCFDLVKEIPRQHMAE